MGHDDDLRHRQRNHTPSAQWQWFPNNRTTVSAKYLGFWTDDKPHVPTDAPDHPGYINWWKWADYGINGAFPYVEAQKSSRQTIQADLSHFADEFLGQHDIKFGVQYTKGRGNWQGGYFQNYVNFLYPYRWTQTVQYMQDWYGDTDCSSTTSETPSTRSSPCARPTPRRVLRRPVVRQPIASRSTSGSGSTA